jgi:HAD superfamily hydrolase (TIGR01549 family)
MRSSVLPVDAIIFDLDGVLLDSEPIWSEVRKEYTIARGGHWVSDAQERMMGMSTQEWAQYLHDDLRVPVPAGTIADEVIYEMVRRYGTAPPWFPGAVDAVKRMAQRWPIGLASSSPSRLIGVVLQTSELGEYVKVALSTEEVGKGKPAPDVYLAVAARLGVIPDRCAAVEDSTNGLRSARAAGMRVIAVPTSTYPPDPEELRHADVVLDGVAALTEEVVVDGGPDGQETTGST